MRIKPMIFTEAMTAGELKSILADVPDWEKIGVVVMRENAWGGISRSVERVVKADLHAEGPRVWIWPEGIR